MLVQRVMQLFQMMYSLWSITNRIREYHYKSHPKVFKFRETYSDGYKISKLLIFAWNLGFLYWQQVLSFSPPSSLCECLRKYLPNSQVWITIFGMSAGCFFSNKNMFYEKKMYSWAHNLNICTRAFLQGSHSTWHAAKVPSAHAYHFVIGNIKKQLTLLEGSLAIPNNNIHLLLVQQSYF